MFSTKIRGIVKESPIKLKLVFKGEELATTRSSPTLNCHQGTYKETITKTKREILPKKPNQSKVSNLKYYLRNKFLVQKFEQNRNKLNSFANNLFCHY